MPGVNLRELPFDILASVGYDVALTLDITSDPPYTPTGVVAQVVSARGEVLEDFTPVADVGSLVLSLTAAQTESIGTVGARWFLVVDGRPWLGGRFDLSTPGVSPGGYRREAGLSLTDWTITVGPLVGGVINDPVARAAATAAQAAAADASDAADLALTVAQDAIPKVALRTGLVLDNEADEDFLDAIVLRAGVTTQHKRYFNFEGIDELTKWRMGVNALNQFIVFDNMGEQHLFLALPESMGGHVQINAQGGGATNLNSEVGASNGGFHVYSGGAAPARWIALDGTGFRVFQAGVERARITGTGNLGLRTTDFGGGVGAIVALPPTPVPPTADPATGGLLYVDGALMRWRTAGRLDTIAFEADVAAVDTKVDALNANVRTFGAVGDGITDDTAAIQEAINDANGLRPVYLPPGTYLVGGPRQAPFDSVLTYPPGTTIYGDGSASVVKLANGYTVAGDYKIIGPNTLGPTDNVTFRDFKIDCNGLNNLVLGSSGGNVRRALAIFVQRGTNVTVDNVEAVDCPGRNVFCLGNNGDHDIANATVTNNRLLIFGSGVPGNDPQNDCSAIYCQARGGLIFNNTLIGQATVPNPSVDKMTAIEVHGSATIVKGNRVANCTRMGNQAATVMDSIGNEWRDNVSDRGGNICLFSFAPFSQRDLIISGNVIRLSGANLVEAGIMAPPTTVTTTAPTNVIISGNVIEGDVASGVAGAMHGVYFAAADGLQVTDNTFRNLPGDAVHLVNWSDLPMRKVNVTENTMDNVGFGTGGSRPNAIFLLNASPSTLFEQITIDRNTITKPAAAGPARGINLTGPGLMRDVTIGRGNRFFNIANPTLLITQTSAAAFERVTVEPREFSGLTAASPTSGNWLKGDVIRHTDVAASGTLGKVCTTAGGAASGVWAATTAYSLGQWVRTSGNKFLECVVAGTSGAVEPNPTTLGATAVDGSVTWAYRDFVVAVFKTFGAVAA